MPKKYMKMRYRRYRTKRRRKYLTLRKAKRILMPWKNPRKEEVKYVTISGSDQSLPILYSAVGLTDLNSQANYQSDLLQYITQGTNYDDRIGNSIFLKSISYKFFVWGCPSGQTYAHVNDFQFRIIIHDGTAAASTSVTDFFSSSVKRPFTGRVNRKKFNVYYDKNYRVGSSFYTSSQTGSLYTLTGPSRLIQFSIPVNRVVTFRNDSASPKECRDYFSMAAYVGVPGMGTASNLAQVACMDYTMRAYFTDA